MKISDLHRRIYIDMDGVIVDCTKATALYNKISISQLNSVGWDSGYWKNILQNGNMEEFFTNMDWESNGQRLLKWFNDRNLSYTFLSRPTSPPTTQACIRGKKAWLKSHGLDDVPVIFAFDKSLYAEPGDILIDDLVANIEGWNGADGLGLLYDNDKISRTLHHLEKIFPEKG
jgi:5'(3')-deoxyribonucleotidase